MAKKEAHKISRLTCNRCGFVFTLEANLNECPYDGNSLKEIAFDPLIGMVLDGKYEILSQIGSGGMSLVYRAKMRNGRSVAVKTLQAYLRSDEMTVLRFKQEIQAMSSLQHPNVVSILDHGVTPENQPYLVMDYVAGKPLSRVIKDKGRIDWRAAIPIFIQVCDGLDSAHSRGIVHRDIKPGNIMITQQGLAPMQARVVDFGIAKLMYGGGQRLTRTGEVIGSPLYMSPEQCTGDTLDHRTDMYALACVMHETLTGRPPLVGVNVADMMHMHLQTPPPSLSVSRPDAEFPAELEGIILRMLSKRKEERYDSLLTVREQLHALALRGGLYAPAVATFSMPDEEKKSKRRGLGIMVELGLALLVVTLFGAGVVMWGMPIADLHKMNSFYKVGLKQLADRDYENARRSFDDALSLADQVHDQGVSQCRVLAAMSDLFEKMASSERAERADEQIGRVVRTNMTGDLDVDKFAMSTLGAAEEKSSKDAAKTGDLLEKIDYAVSMCLAKARPQIAEKLALKGIELARAVGAPEDRFQRELAMAYLAQEKIPQAEQAFADATKFKRSGDTARDAELARKASSISARAAHVFAGRGLDRQAQRFFSLAVDLSAKDKNQPVVLRQYAEYLSSVGEVHKSAELLAKANARRVNEELP